MAYDGETGEKSIKKVVNLLRNKTKKWIHLLFELEDGTTEKLVCTEGHPFYVEKLGWVKSCDLIENDSVLMYNNSTASLHRKEIEELEVEETTYNFEVEDYHTYYVGENSLLVHNKCAFQEIVDDPTSLWGKFADEVGDILGDIWTKGTYGTKGNGWEFTNSDKMIAYHPGGGRHVGSDYIAEIGEKAKIIRMIGV